MPKEIDEEELKNEYDAGERDFTHLRCLTCDGSLLTLRGVDFSKIFFDQFCGDGANLSESRIVNAHFFQVELDHADLSNSDLGNFRECKARSPRNRAAPAVFCSGGSNSR
jgi:uncharacterized protein YjbI with pentapeptide repeats